MNLSMSDELELFSKELQRYMSPNALEQLAKNVGFVKRKSKYRAQDLVALCIWLNQNIAHTSLVQLCSRLEANTGISMSPEGLNQRFNSQAVQFLQQLLAHLLHQQFCSSSKIPTLYTNYFRSIRVLDSTHFQIPDKFVSTYKGSGGSGQNAGVKIQLEYDLLSGEFSDIKIEPGKRSDQAYGATRTGMIQKNELYIRDLGYFRLQDFKSIQDKQGYYLSRLKLPTKIYRKEFEKVVFKTKPAQFKPVYIQIHLEDIMNQLQPGQVYELHDIYVLFVITHASLAL